MIPDLCLILRKQIILGPRDASSKNAVDFVAKFPSTTVLSPVEAATAAGLGSEGCACLLWLLLIVVVVVVVVVVDVPVLLLLHYADISFLLVLGEAALDTAKSLGSALDGKILIGL